MLFIIAKNDSTRGVNGTAAILGPLNQVHSSLSLSCPLTLILEVSVAVVK